MEKNDNKNPTAEHSKPLIINGDLAVDDRGELMFANQFDMKYVKRFYVVSNHKQGFIYHVNVYHVLFVAPLLIYIGYKNNKTEWGYYELLLILGLPSNLA